MIATVGVLLLSLEIVTKVHFLVPSKALHVRDQTEYADYWKFAGCETKVEYHSDTAFQPKASEILICDEADFFIFRFPW